MQMEHRLARTRPDVVDRAIAVLDATLTSQFGGDQLAVPENLSVFRPCFFQADDVFFGYDEQVRGRLGMDVLKGKDPLVLVDFLGRDFSLDDLAEEAVRHRESV